MMPNDWIKYATTSRREFLKKASVGLAGGQFLSKERYRSKTQEPDIYQVERQKYRQLWQDLTRLDDVWDISPSELLSGWAEDLQNSAINAVKPGTGLPQLLPDSVNNVRTLLDQMATTIGVMEQSKIEQGRRTLRLQWRTNIDGYDDTVQEQYYKQLGYEVNADQVTNQPFFALYRVLKNDLVRVANGQQSPEILRDHADVVHDVLKQQILPPNLEASNSYERSMVKNLRLLDILAVTIRNATQQSISETGFIDDFEDGGFARWTPVNLPERARDISGNNWRVTSNAISGQYSLAIETIGDNDDNAIATKNQVVDLARDFSISFKWLSPDPSNRGPRLNLLSRPGSEFENERSDSIHPANGIAVGYDPDAISRRGSPYRGKAGFCGNSFNRESYAADTVHTVRIEKQGDNATLFLDGQNQQGATVDRTGQYRLLLSSSGTWGNSSSIMFDDIRIRYNM